MSNSAASRFERLATGRIQALTRARECARLTIPSLVPPEGANETTVYPTPYQSLGAKGVNNLASRLVLALFPPNQPIFRYTIGDLALEEFAQKAGARAEIEKALNRIEREVTSDMEASGIRGPLFEVVKHLLVAGNLALQEKDDGSLRVWPLESYVVRRSPNGKPLEAILMDRLAPDEVPSSHLATLPTGYVMSDDPERSIRLFTHCKLVKNGWEVRQYLETSEVSVIDRRYSEDEFPFHFLATYHCAGTHYSRSYVSEIVGDLWSTEALTKAIVQASAASARVIFLVRPGASTSVQDLERAENGAFVTGLPEDVTCLTLDKSADLKVTEGTRQALVESLSASFMLTSGVVRDAERVTAEEIRALINELERGLGGLYSTLGATLQLPLVKTRIARMSKQGRLPALPKGLIHPTIVTGLDALGRGNDVDKLERLAAIVNAAFGPDEARLALHSSDFAARVATGLGIDQNGLVKTADDRAAELEQQQQQALAEKAMGPAISAGASLATAEAAPQ